LGTGGTIGEPVGDAVEDSVGDLVGELVEDATGDAVGDKVGIDVVDLSHAPAGTTTRGEPDGLSHSSTHVAPPPYSKNSTTTSA